MQNTKVQRGTGDDSLSPNMTPADAILHEVGETPRRFARMAEAMRTAWEEKTTGYIVDPEHTVINLRKGKRAGMKPGTWIPCNVGY